MQTIGLGDDFFQGIEMPPSLGGDTYWFVFRDSDVLVRRDSAGVSLPRGQRMSPAGLALVRTHYLGSLNGVDCCSGEVGKDSLPPEGYEFVNLRQLHGVGDERLFWIGGRAIQIVDWDRTHQFCGACGTATRLRVNERARECPTCGLTCFPRLAPAIIVLIEKGDEILLAHSLNLAANVYSLVAGFVEPGETLEQAVVREVREEVGLEIKNIRYFGSQPWPFPHSLMVGFTADYAGGAIRVEPAEVSDAAWYRYDRMPTIPGPISISRRLIDSYLAKHGTA